jgi:hypothetical protein
MLWNGLFNNNHKKRRKELFMENKFMRVEEVAAELGVSASYAYKVIRRLNDELKAKGFVTIAGRINRQYFNERVYGPGKEDCNNVRV